MKNKKTLFLIICCFFLIVGVSAQKKQRKTDNNETATILNEKTAVENAGKFIDAVKERIIGNIDAAETQLRDLIIAEPMNDAAHFEYAQVLIARNRIQEAILELKTAIQLNKENIWYKIYLANLYNMTRNFSEAEKLWKLIVEKQPDNLEYLYYYTFALINQNKLKKAIKMYDKMEMQIGINEELIETKHRIWLDLKNKKNAGKELEKLVEAFPNEIRYYLIVADFYNKNDMSKNAIPYIEKAKEIEPNNPEINIILYNHYLANKKYDKAFNALEKIFAAPSLPVEEKVKIIMNYYPLITQNHRYKKEAFILLDTLVKTHPENPITWSAYGDFAIAIGDYNKASEAYGNVLEHDPSKYAVWEQYLSLLIELNQWEKAFEKSREAMELFPTQTLPYFINGLVAIELGDWNTAISSLEKGKDFVIDNEKLLEETYFYLAEAYHQIENHQKSDEYFEKILSISPNNAIALNNYAYFLSLRKERLDYALGMAKKANELEPNTDMYEDTYAWIYFQKGDLENAEYWIKKALYNNKETSTEILEHYGDILYEKGEHTKALEYWNKAKEKGESSEQLLKKIENLQH